MSAPVFIEITACGRRNGADGGHVYRILVGTDERATGWCAGTRNEARREAREHAARLGLRIGGGR